MSANCPPLLPGHEDPLRTKSPNLCFGPRRLFSLINTLCLFAMSIHAWLLHLLLYRKFISTASLIRYVIITIILFCFVSVYWPHYSLFTQQVFKTDNLLRYVITEHIAFRRRTYRFITYNKNLVLYFFAYIAHL